MDRFFWLILLGGAGFVAWRSGLVTRLFPSLETPKARPDKPTEKKPKDTAPKKSTPRNFVPKKKAPKRRVKRSAPPVETRKRTDLIKKPTKKPKPRKRKIRRKIKLVDATPKQQFDLYVPPGVKKQVQERGQLTDRTPEKEDAPDVSGIQNTQLIASF